MTALDTTPAPAGAPRAGGPQDGGTALDAGGQRTPMRPAKSPTGAGPVGVVGPLLAVLLGGLGVVLLHDALVAAGAMTGSWLQPATRSLVGVRPAGWMVPAGLVLALLGLWLLLTALRRRTRRTLALDSRTGAFIGTGDLARRASAAAQDVDGVLSASSSATRRTVTVQVTTTGDASIPGAVRDSVTAGVSTLAAPPRVRVRATSHSDERTTS